MVIVLSIESTAHTFGIGIVRDGKILANIKDSYTTSLGGIIPVESAKHHEEVKDKVYQEALEKANVDEKAIDAIAFSQGPGLAPCLLVGLRFAKELARKLNKPLIAVNHCVAHLEIGKITGAKDPVLLYCSGANTQIIAYAAGKYRIFGETLDIGIGNFIDTFARYAGIGFPGGKRIEELAKSGKTYIELPYSIKGMDVAFSGMLTKLRNLLEKLNSDSDFANSKVPTSPCVVADRKGEQENNLLTEKNLLKYKLEDLAYSLQETAFAMLVEASERAMAHTGKTELLLGGGVACNSRLKQMCEIMCKERKASFFCPENLLLQDNGAMIAFQGELQIKEAIPVSDIDKLDIKPRQRTDDVEIKYK